MIRRNLGGVFFSILLTGPGRFTDYRAVLILRKSGQNFDSYFLYLTYHRLSREKRKA